MDVTFWISEKFKVQRENKEMKNEIQLRDPCLSCNPVMGDGSVYNNCFTLFHC